MALDPNSNIGQAENANDKLAQYFSDINKFLVNTDGTVLPPDFEDFVSTFDYSELHRTAVIKSTDAANFQNGAAIENIHHMVAIIREYDLRKKGKINYYADGATEALRESDFYATLKVFWVNMLNGIYVEGETS